MMKLHLLYLFIFSSIISFSQVKISGTIYNSNNETLPYSNVRVYTSSKLKTYAVSDEKGRYNLHLDSGVYIFKVSYLGYKSISIKKEIFTGKTINFVLKEDAENLKEVVLKAKSLDAYIKNDTTNYNIKRFMNGSENNLKDILTKLPGIVIDENGKINANGKKIDKLLINGKSFFGNQHQLATQNISSEMVKSISLIDNFNDFSVLNKKTKSGKTAINIDINDKYKGAIKGNLSILGGIDKKYEFGANIFSFNSKTNLFFIGNANNIGSQSLSFEDYISFQGGIDKILESEKGSSGFLSKKKDFPSYLFPNNNIKTKNDKFSAFNISYNPTNNFKLNSYIIFDKINIEEQQSSKQIYLTEKQNIISNVDISKSNSFKTYNLFLDASFKPSEKSFLSYKLNISPNKNNLLRDDNLTINKYKTKTDINNFSFNQTINYKQIFNKYTLSTLFFYSMNDENKGLNIESSKSFLGLTFKKDKYFAYQTSINRNSEFGANFSLKKNLLKNIVLNCKYGISKQNRYFMSDIYDNYINNNIRLNIFKNIFGISISNKNKGFFDYNIGSNYSILNKNKVNSYNLLPFAHINFNFKKTHNLKLSYKKTEQIPFANNLSKNRYIMNYNTFIQNQNLKFSDISTYNNFSIRYLIYDLFSGTLFSVGGNMVIGNNIISTNSININDYTSNNFIQGNSDKKTNMYLLFDKKFDKIPFSVRVKSTYSITENNDFANHVLNKINYTVFSNDIKISSDFQNSNINFDFGYKINQSDISIDRINFNNKVILHNPFLNLSFINKKINLIINNSIEFYDSKLALETIYKISPSFSYNSKNNWKFTLKGNNILNMNKNFIIENAIYKNYYEDKITSILSGYIIIGLSYKF